MKISLSILSTIVILTVSATSAYSQVTLFNNGTSNTISFSTSDYLEVEDSDSGSKTTLNLVSGAAVNGENNSDTSVLLWDDSTLNISGGSVAQDVDAYDTSSIQMTGGTIQDDIYLYDRSSANISGGVIADDINMYYLSTLTFSGGSIGEDLEVQHGASANVTGGSIAGNLRVKNQAVINLSGGSLLGSGGFEATSGGILNISGYNFKLGDSDVGYGTLSDATGTITGTLLDGSSFVMDFYVDSFSAINLTATAVPEPATYATLIGMLSIAGAVYRNRKDRSKKQ